MNWILWSEVFETALVIIPEEAEIVISMLRYIKRPNIHLLTYAAPVTKKMLHFNDLNYYTMPAMPTGWKAPRWLKLELGLFAGRLYFEWDEYDDLRKYLGISLDSDEKVAESPIKSQKFTTKPMELLQDWLAVRRRGQDFAHTPMGYVCQDKPLTADHPFFKQSEPRDQTLMHAATNSSTAHATTSVSLYDGTSTVDQTEEDSDGGFDENEIDLEEDGHGLEGYEEEGDIEYHVSDEDSEEGKNDVEYHVSDEEGDVQD